MDWCVEPFGRLVMGVLNSKIYYFINKFKRNNSQKVQAEEMECDDNTDIKPIQSAIRIDIDLSNLADKDDSGNV